MKTIGGYEIKYCPFCKEEENLDILRETGLYFVTCGNIDCSAAGPVDFGISGAVAKWNERAKEA